jgi:hypothetical protein
MSSGMLPPGNPKTRMVSEAQGANFSYFAYCLNQRACKGLDGARSSVALCLRLAWAVQ